jgi:YD repeat-containing protein
VSFSYTTANPTTVQIGATTIQTMSYPSGYLTNITDGDGNKIIDVAYASATAGKVVSVTTGGGAVGYEYGSINSQCTGGTVLFFNTTGTACSSDSQCSGYRCGGKTGAGGNDGKCYRGARCLSTTSPSENLVTAMAALTPCTGSCAPTAQYSWNTSTLDLKGIKLADNNWTSFQRDGNGMVMLMAKGDNDDDPTNSGGAKTWFFYGASAFPGRVTESRTRSDLYPPGASGCDNVTTTACKRTQFGWNNTTGLLDSRTDIGYTRDTSNAPASFSYLTTFTHDSNGRLKQVDGPLSGSDDLTIYSYWTSTDVLFDGYPSSIQRNTSASHSQTTYFDEYDYFGNAKRTKDPDGTLTCRTWDSNRDALTQIREAMAGQTSCTTIDPSDLTTAYIRDTRLRITKTTRPLGDCTFDAYDAFGRLSTSKLRDDCVATSSGSTRSETYDANGLHLKTEMLDASGNVKDRIEDTYLDSMQVDSIKNPVAPSYARSFVYLTDVPPSTLTFENGLGKNGWLWDAQNRSTTQQRYTDATNHLDWAFGYPASDATSARIPEKVTDPASKVTEVSYDDLGRKARVVSPDSGTTLYVYDAASNVTTMIEAYGSSDQLTHTFTYDLLGRKLTEDYADAVEDCTDGLGHVTETTYGWDTSPVSCPTNALCTNQAGRLAYVKTKLLCDSSYADSTLDQETFYAYDPAGRLVQEYIQDDTGRTGDQRYTWDRNGNLMQVQTPSGAAIAYTLGGSGNSDANLVTSVARTMSGVTTTLLSNITWAPFGPVTGYDQANSIGGNVIKAALTWNLAYRPTQIKYATTTVNKTTIDYSEDEKGRITSKVYSNVHSNIANSYVQYDFFDRPTCDATVSGTCPTSGSTLRTNVKLPSGAPGYNNSNDRAGFYHQDPAYGDYNYGVNFVTGADMISSIVQSGSAGTTSFLWNGRGQRLSDDNDNSTRDGRNYTYEGRGRVRSVSGQYFSGGCIAGSYRVTYAYDHKDRLVFRSWYRSSDGFQNQTFYYYDLNDRLIEVKVLPNAADTSTYTIYDFYWLGHRPVAMWATSFPGSTTARYFMHADDSNRVLEVYDWPSSGDANLVWGVNPDEFGWDRIAIGTIFQPLRLNNALYDQDTRAPKSCASFVTTFDRPGLLLDRGTTYDPFTETTLQRFGTWPDEPFGLGSHNPARGFAATITPTMAYPSGGTTSVYQINTSAPGDTCGGPPTPGGSLPTFPTVDWPAGFIDAFDPFHVIADQDAPDSMIDWPEGDPTEQDPCSGEPLGTPTDPIRIPGEIRPEQIGCQYDERAGFNPDACSKCVATCVAQVEAQTGETGCLYHECSAWFLDAYSACKHQSCQVESPVCAVTCVLPVPPQPKGPGQLLSPPTTLR